MSHSVFSDPRLQKLSGDTFKLFLWMLTQAWRFPDSDGKLRASIHFIAEALQMSPSTVSRSLLRLREDRLIELMKTDYRNGNIWAVEGVGVGQDSTAELAQNEVPQNEGGDAAKHLPAPSISESSSLNLNKQLCQNEGETRKTRKQETLSLVVSQQNTEDANNAANDPDEIELGKYLTSLTAPRKRLSEEHWLRELRKSHPASEVALALRHLREHGALGSGETCHSPLRYLATAMKDVLAAAHPLAEQRKRAQDDFDARTRREREQAELEALENADWREAEGAFVAAFPTESEQAVQVEAFVGEQLHGIRPPGGVARRLAVRHWWSHEGKQGEPGRLTGYTGQSYG